MSTFSLFNKKFVSWVLMMLFLVLIVSLSRNAWDLWNMRSRITDAEADVRALAGEKETLEAQYKQQTSPYAIEREIRDKLNMAKPGEEVLIVPDEAREVRGAGNAFERVSENKQLEEADMPNWKKWWRVINP